MKKLLLLMTVLCLGMAGVASAQLWQSQDIGGPAMAGSAVQNPDGSFSVTASGADIWGTSDQFHFAYVEMNGDVEIIAKVAGFVGGTNGWRKAGVMVRDSLEANSRQGFCALTPTESHGYTFQRRLETGGESFSDHPGGGTAPWWVRLVRVGNQFSGYQAADVGGAPGAWSQIGATQINMDVGTTDYVGLAVTSHNNAESTTATFDNVTIDGVPFGGEAWGAVSWDPAPSAKDVPVGVYPLSWTAVPPSGQTIDHYKVYMGLSKAAIDPNNPHVEDHLLGGGPVAGPPVDSLDLVSDTTYYWRVASWVSDANMMNGVIVKFDTISYGPEITQDPQDTRFGAGCTGAVLSVVAGPKVEGEGGTITYQWYQVGAPDVLLSGETADTLLTNVPGNYYVVVSNDAGEDVSDAANVAVSIHASPGGGDGYALHERFPNAGNTLAAARELLTLDSSTATLTELVSVTLVDPDIDNYRARLTWWLMPTVSGTYQFRIAADDFAGLWISTNTDPADAEEIAYIDGWTNIDEWGKYPTQTSDEIELEAGLIYFMRGGYTEGGGGDHMHIQWLLPGSTTWADISGGVMNSFLPDLWAAQNIALSPVDGNGWLDYNATEVTVSWDNAQYAPCDAVYHLYLESADAAFPLTEVWTGTESPATVAVPEGLLQHDQMWYYHIDVSSAAGADTELGQTFSISTIKWVPEISTNPKDLNVVKAGSDLTLQCVAMALNEDDAAMTEYNWYRDGNLVFTGTPVEISRDGKRYYDCSVTLTPQSTADEGFYYCVAVNDNGTATSTEAKVLTERLMVHFTFDELNGNTVNDSSATGEFDGTLTSPQAGGIPTGATIVAGVVGNALDLTGGQDPNAAFVGTSASAFDLGIRGANPKSVSVWVKSRDMARSGVYYIGQRAVTMAVFGCHNSNDPGNNVVYQFDHWGANYDYADFSALGTWVHIAHIYDGQRIRIYIDGVKMADYAAALNTASGDVTNVADLAAAQPLLIGMWGDYNAGYQHGVLDGVIDDFRLYNYALSPVEVGSLWMLGGGAGGCMEALSQDSNGDCRVNLIDFAALGASWMESSLITP